jgi:hypothetical protein
MLESAHHTASQWLAAASVRDPPYQHPPVTARVLPTIS